MKKLLTIIFVFFCISSFAQDSLITNRGVIKSNKMSYTDSATMLLPYLRKNGIIVTSLPGAASWNPATLTLNIPASVLDDTLRYIVRACILRPVLYGALGDSVRWDVVRPGGGGGTYGAHTTINMTNATTDSRSGQITLHYGTPGHLGDSVIYAVAGVDDVFNTAGITVSGSYGTDSAILWPLQKIQVGGYVNFSGTSFSTSGYVINTTAFNTTTGKITVSVPAAYEPSDLSKYAITPATNGTSIVGYPVVSRTENTTTSLAIYMIDFLGNPILSFPTSTGFNVSGPYVTAGFFTLKSPAWQQTPIINGGAILFLQIVKRP